MKVKIIPKTIMPYGGGISLVYDVLKHSGLLEFMDEKIGSSIGQKHLFPLHRRGGQLGKTSPQGNPEYQSHPKIGVLIV